MPRFSTSSATSSESNLEETTFSSSSSSQRRLETQSQALRAQFDLGDPQDWTIANFKCALYLYHVPTFGTMSVTMDYICFHGKHLRYYDTKKQIAFSDIESIEKHHMLVTPTAIHIITKDEKLLFHGFNERDSCFALLEHIWKYRRGSENERYRVQTVKDFKSLQSVASAPNIRNVSSSFSFSSSSSSSSRKNASSGRTSEIQSAKKKLFFNSDDSEGQEDERSTGDSIRSYETTNDDMTAHYYSKSNAVLDKSTKSLQQSIMIAEQSRSLGEETLVRLDSQGEQIRDIKRRVEDIDTDLYRADRLVRGMSIGGTISNAFTSRNVDKLKQKTIDRRMKLSNNDLTYNSAKCIDMLCINKHGYTPQLLSFSSEYFRRIDPVNQTLLDTYPYTSLRQLTIVENPLQVTVMFNTTDYKPIEFLSVRFRDIIQKILNHSTRRKIDVEDDLASWWLRPTKNSPRPLPGPIDDGYDASSNNNESSKAHSRSNLDESRTNKQKPSSTSSFRNKPSSSKSSAASSQVPRGASSESDLIQMYEERTQMRDKQLDHLSHVLTDMKQISELMNDTLTEQNQDLEELDESMDRTVEHVRGNVKKINRILRK